MTHLHWALEKPERLVGTGYLTTRCGRVVTLDQIAVAPTCAKCLEYARRIGFVEVDET